jgi:hypothetical protein
MEYKHEEWINSDELLKALGVNEQILTTPVRKITIFASFENNGWSKRSL